MRKTLKKYLLYPLRGLLNIIFMMVATIFISVGVYAVAAITFVMPSKKCRDTVKRFLHRFPVYWIDLLGFSMRIVAGKRYQINGPSELDTQKPYLLISNHASALDILVLSYAFHRKTPCMKFFMKKQLIWSLPFAGLATWLLDYPFMERHTASQIRKRPELKNKDIETTKKACQKFIEHPATIMNYVEGTRFSQQKREQKGSPYQYLLKPKTAGIAIVANELQQALAGIIDATIAYCPQGLSFWKFACGDFDKIICHYRLIPLSPDMLGNYYQDRDYRKRIQAWLNDLWQEKDERLKNIYHQKNP